MNWGTFTEKRVSLGDATFIELSWKLRFCDFKNLLIKDEIAQHDINSAEAER